jgi:hypothetical protein
MREVQASIDVAAGSDRVWDVITAFREYDEWNPVITKMRATLTVGAPVSFVLSIAGRRLKIRAEVLVVQHGRELCWFGPRERLLGAIFRGEHYLRVEPAGANASRVVHGERFSGFSLPLLWEKVRRECEPAYAEMNRALKARAESAWSGVAASARGLP